MYIFFSFIIFSLFFNNFFNLFLIYFFALFLIYFFYMKNSIFSLESYSFSEDRLVILLENITKIEYNYFFILALIFIFSYLLFFGSKVHSFTLFIFCILNFNFYFCFQDLYSTIFTQFRFNTKLLNGLFLIHPLMIYVFYCLIITFSYTYISLTITKYYNQNNYLSTINLFSIQKYLKICTFFGLVAISLGSWWAFQEINWNGWWSWDLIEVINLLLILIILKFLHTNTTNLYNYYLTINSRFFILLLLPIFFMGISRFNLVNSLHSFVLLDNFSQFYFLVQIVTILICLFAFYVRKVDTLYLIIPTKLQLINFLSLFFYTFFTIFFYKLLYELYVFFFNLQSFLEYFYFFKHYLNFLITSSLLLILNIQVSLFYSFFSFFCFSFIEILIFILVMHFFYKKSGYFIKWHIPIFIFILINFFNFYMLDYSYKNWNFNFISVMENFKVNYSLIKTSYTNLSVNFNNILPSEVSLCTIQTNDLNLLTYSKSNIYFLSDFFIKNNSFLITNYKFFFFYNYLFTKYLALYYVLWLICAFIFPLLSKKLGLTLI